MDKELLRIVIIATGFLVMIGMILWSYLNGRQQDDEVDEMPREKAIGSKGKLDESLRIHHERDEFDIIPIGSAKPNLARDDDEDGWSQEFNDRFDDDEDIEGDDTSAKHIVVPDVLQFAIMSTAESGFNGVDVDNALGDAGLEYGNLKVYERINDSGQVDYGVACMVQPGTFPEGAALEAFFCPGIVFYLQHADLDNAQEVFDDFVVTIKQVAKDLNGEIWDHQRHILTEPTIAAIKQSL